MGKQEADKRPGNISMASTCRDEEKKKSNLFVELTQNYFYP